MSTVLCILNQTTQNQQLLLCMRVTVDSYILYRPMLDNASTVLGQDPWSCAGSVHASVLRDSYALIMFPAMAPRWGADEALDYKAVSLAEKVMKAGLAQLPGDAFMAILYSNFLIDVQGSYQSGVTQLQASWLR